MFLKDPYLSFTTIYHFLPLYDTIIPSSDITRRNFPLYSLYITGGKTWWSVCVVCDASLTFWQSQVFRPLFTNKIPPDRLSDGIRKVYHYGKLLTLTNSHVFYLAMSKKSCTLRLWEGGKYTIKKEFRDKKNITNICDIFS